VSKVSPQRRVLRALSVVGLLGLELLLAGHLALEAHTVSSDGGFVEVRGDDAHAHDERSLCDGSALGGHWFDAGPCEAQLDAHVAAPHAESPGRMAAAALAGFDTGRQHVAARRAVWREAPKGSPPGV
jgi:hypothetical protein